MPGLLRLILIIIFIWLAIYWYRKLFPAKKPGAAAPTEKKEIENMVRCAVCGLHVPEKQALQEGTDYYCSDAHRLQHHPQD